MLYEQFEFFQLWTFDYNNDIENRCKTEIRDMAGHIHVFILLFQGT